MNTSLLAVAILAALLATQAAGQGPYKPNWQSLQKHTIAPEWFRDAKFGIYCHWGPYSVPAFGTEWYPRTMFIKGSPENKHHIATFGDPNKFGYDKFVAMFTAEKFNAEEWADLFARSGAKFAGPVSEHHDGFALWDSKLTPWNSVEMGPRKDITRLLEKAIRAKGMKFITTFHHSRNALWQKNGQWTGHFDHVKLDYPSVLEDPKLAFLYGYMPHTNFVKLWKDKLAEVIDKYSPDLIWFDYAVDEIPEKDQQEFLAHYFNHAQARNQDVLVTVKNFDMPKTVTVEDFEKGRLDDLTEDPWLTDDTISWGSWSYTTDLEIKDVATVVKTLCDIVSKNGQLLLNASPRADGSFPQNQKDVLLGIGDWLRTNGEAIFITRPWLVYGEGPTKMDKGGHFVGKVDYTADDVRYTRTKDQKALYAITLGKPKAGRLVLRSIAIPASSKLGTVEIVGLPGEVTWQRSRDGQLELNIPNLPGPDHPAYAFKLQGFDVSVHPDSLFSRPNAIRLAPEKAVVEGEQAKLETHGSNSNIGFWDKPTDKVHWLAYIPKAGDYQIRGSFAAAAGTTSAVLSVSGKSARFEIPSSTDWRKPSLVSGGKMTFTKAGVYQFTLAPAEVKAWRAVNVFSIELARIP